MPGDHTCNKQCGTAHSNMVIVSCEGEAITDSEVLLIHGVWYTPASFPRPSLPQRLGTQPRHLLLQKKGCYRVTQLLLQHVHNRSGNMAFPVMR